MSNIRIVTDSSSDIPAELVKKYSIETVPLYVGFDGKMMKDLIEIRPEEVYEALAADKKVITASPSVGDFIAVFKRLIEEEKADRIYCITLSSKLSASNNAANVAKNSFPEGKIKIFDSKTSTMCLGFTVLQAAMAVNANYSEIEIENLIEELIRRNKFIAVLESFEYVMKGGRGVFLSKFISKAIKFVPILHIGKEGTVKLKKFVRNKEKAIFEMYLQTIAVARLNKENYISIFYGADLAPVKELERLIRQNKEIVIADIIYNKITTVMGAHTGPGIWGVAISPKLLPGGV
ncbi:MAG: DegV family protein [Actinomycetota bacterium]|nr:DegV family protein [Actinomycetota bacterium]